MTPIVDSTLRFAVSMLLAGLWQAPVFAFAAWLVLRFAPRANATTRHSIFAAALVASLVLPVATAVLAIDTISRHAMLMTDDVPLPRGARSTHPIRPATILPETIRRPNTEPASPMLAVPALDRFAITLPAWLTLTIVALWIASAALVLGRLLVSLVHLESLKRDALPLDVTYRDGLARWSKADKGSRNVRLCVSNEIEIPIAVGLFDAMILVPQRLMDELEPSEIDAIVLHELAHLRRGDDWFNALERVAAALLFFNPGVLWLASQLDLEREVACDDWVLQQNDALPYASCLAKVAAAAAWPHRAAPAPGIFASRRGMSIRIERLLTKQRNVRVRTSLGVATSAAILIGTLGLAAALVSPSIAEETAAPFVSANVGTTHVRAVEDHVRRNDEKRRRIADHDVTTIVVSTPHVPLHPEIAVRPKHLVVVAPAAAQRALPVAVALADAGSGATAAAAAPAVSSAPLTPVAPTVRAIADASQPDHSDAYRGLGYDRLTIDELIKLRSTGVTPNYVRALQASGIGHPSIDDLVALRSTGVDARFVTRMRRKHGDHLSVRDLIELRTAGDESSNRQVADADLDMPDVRNFVHLGSLVDLDSLKDLEKLKADPAYVAAMRRHFGPSLTIDQITSMRAVGVTPEYVDAMSAAGVAHLSTEQIVSMHALGISPGYVRELASLGYGNLSTDDLASLRALGIDGAYIRRVQQDGYPHPSVDELRQLKATGAL